MGETEDERTARASQLFETFVQATTCKGTLQAFSILCRQLELDPLDHAHFYSCLKDAVTSWKVKTLWTKLDKRAQHKAYEQNTACQGTRCLIIGGGPCGLRTAIELALLGCKVVVIEKRDTFSRNNVLHLWPYTIHDLRGLGAKKFYGKFCAGSIDHISIRQLQLMLLKVALILGIEIHVNVEFVKLLEPPEEQTDDSPGWRAEVRPATHPVSEFDFDVIIGADGRRNTLDGFSRKEFRGKLAIAITANFVNRNTTAEAKVEEISGVAFIFNQKFFLELKEETGIDLENIVYYKDNTHYFVMTAKKQSLLDKGVILNDYLETERLLSPDNVDQEALLSYAREAADFGTNYQLPSLDYAINHYGQPDVAMFDFTSMYASENAALIREKRGHQLLVALVGDSLLEPFWPMGTGCARGFLAAFDAAWMVKGWAQGRNPLEVLAERESIYRLLPQTTPENLSKNFDQYTIDPTTRYPNLNSTCVRPHQVRHLFFDGKQVSGLLERHPTRQSASLSRRESEVRPSRLLSWCQRQTQGYRGVEVTNLTSSWRSGLALCALIHRQRPDLIDFDCLNEEDVAENNQLAFDVAEREFNIQPVTTGKEMAAQGEPDKLLMVLYLSKFYEAFRNSPLNGKGSKELDENTKDYATNNNQPRKRIPRVEDKKAEDDSVNKRRRKGDHYLSELSCHSAPPPGENGDLRENKVRSMATQLLAKFEENSTTGKIRTKCVGRGGFAPTLGGSDTCHFCSKRVYVMERLSADGHFFHRDCFRCDVCNCVLRLGTHTYDSREGKFYCKVHYAQHLSSTIFGKFGRRTDDQSQNNTQACTAASTDAVAGVEHETGGTQTDTEMAREALEASCLVTASNEPEETKATSQGGLKDQTNAKQSHRWKRKIQATFPLIFVKHFQRSWSGDKPGPETVPEADSDFEDLTPADSHVLPECSKADPQCPSEGKEEREQSSAKSKAGERAPAPKKRLTIPVCEKEKLLDWDVVTTEEASRQINKSEAKTEEHNEQVQTDSMGDKAQIDLVQDPAQSQNPPSSVFQLIASAFRKNHPSSPNSTVIMRPKRDGSRRPRPMSEGAFNFSSLFSSAELGSDKHKLGSEVPSVSSDPWGAGRDLPSLLQQVSLKSRRVSEAHLPRRRVDLFSSLRLRKRQGGESEEIRTILTNLRNKASSQQSLQELSSSEDENDNPVFTKKWHPDRQRRRQEKIQAQQAKRDQLKRLHRAQAIQRQLEEVGEKQRNLEERGVAIEKLIRGEAEKSHSDDRDEAQLYQTWFKLVLEKNRLARYESELMIFAQELELEDTQSRLQQELRKRMAVEDTKKSASELQQEQEMLAEIMRTVERRDKLVCALEEQRLKERAEDRDLESLLLSRGYEFHWAHLDDGEEQDQGDGPDG
ncbi:F-actin-monooxygenase mical2b isoform X3 [Boleophthalmus pectinirostris]|uniref:F-actin-monooxygenase mical2b isoform X3 n=1 Tax=Boleophthalmus pectinirostris TaxID=150288 RepID=UPI000A1C3749|nr:F-actin-monooxygenase mical2b isoform X3 [Boleophthalmus pectinirostris]